VTTDRELIRELLDDLEDEVASVRKQVLRDQLLTLHALLEPLTDGDVYTFSRLGNPTRRAPHAEIERPILHYVGVVSGGRHYLSGRRFRAAESAAANGRIRDGFDARELTAFLLELGVTGEQVRVLRADDDVAAVLAEPEPTTFRVGDRVRTKTNYADSTWEEATVVEVQPTFLPYRVENTDGTWLWFAADALMKLEG
jgi:hypothetical protein